MNSPPQERVAAKARAQNQAANLCSKGILREIAEEKQTTPASGTYKCLEACPILERSTTKTVISRSGNLLLAAA